MGLSQALLACLLSVSNHELLLQTAMTYKAVPLIEFIEWLYRTSIRGARNHCSNSNIRDSNHTEHQSISAVSATILLDPLLESDMDEITKDFDSVKIPTSRVPSTSSDESFGPALQLPERAQMSTTSIGEFPNELLDQRHSVNSIRVGKRSDGPSTLR